MATIERFYRCFDIGQMLRFLPPKLLLLTVVVRPNAVFTGRHLYCIVVLFPNTTSILLQLLYSH